MPENTFMIYEIVYLISVLLKQFDASLFQSKFISVLISVLELRLWIRD